MKKILFMLIFIFLLQRQSFASFGDCAFGDCDSLPGAPGSGQWILSGTDIYNSNGGNVGIGTTVINAKLAVSNVGSSTTSPTTIGFTTGLDVGNAVRISMGDDHNGLQNGYGKRFQMYSYGGIAIHGNRLSSSPLPFEDTGGADASLIAYGGANSGDAFNVFSNSGTNVRTIIDNAGNVGIGTAYAPGGKLVVFGNVGIGTNAPDMGLDMGRNGNNICLRGNCQNNWTSGGNHVDAYQRGVNYSGMTGTGTMGFSGNSYTGVPVTTTVNSIDYSARKGLTLWRLPIQWEYLQHNVNSDLDATYLAQVDLLVADAKASGVKLIMDIHNFGQRRSYLDGGFTENFSTATSFGNSDLQCPQVASYVQSTGVTINQTFEECYAGTKINPISPATGYAVSTTFKFTSEDTVDPANGLIIRPMHSDQSSTSYYEFKAVYGNGTWSLKKVISGSATTLQSGSFAWALNTSYTVAIDINQTSSGFINVSVNGTPLYTNGTQAVDGTLTTGYISYLPITSNMHVLIKNITLDVNGDTSSGGNNGLHKIGTTEVPVSALADLWTKLATHWVDEDTIYGYDIMNEPNAMPVPTTSSNYLPTSVTPATVTSYTNAVIPAIRAVDMKHWIMVESDQFAGISNYVGLYGSNPDVWWTDPANKSMISWHYYFDTNGSGTYTGSYSSVSLTRLPGDVNPPMLWAQSKGIPVFIGEFGAPDGTKTEAQQDSDDLNWQICMDTFMQMMDGYKNNILTAWAFFSRTSVNVLNLNGTFPAFQDRPVMKILLKHLGSGLPDTPYISQIAKSIGTTNGTVASENNGNLSITGNVGIGSVNPTQSIETTGTVKTVGLLTSGNVGIGSPTPDLTLSVLGNGRMASTSPLYFGGDFSASLAASANTIPDLIVTTKSNPDSSTGGTVTYSGADTIRTFTSSTTFTPGFTGNVNVLVVGGGGGGGAHVAGGGGAGGVRDDYVSAPYAVTSGSPITVTIGASGAGGVLAATRNGSNGGNSVFGTITATGGGGGAAYFGATAAGNGGSGGGASPNKTFGTGTVGQGHDGGDQFTSGGIIGGGGGGGCGAVGATSTGTQAGNGGIGCAYSISGASSYYAGGGGASGTFGPAAGSGGSGGGGAGNDSGAGSAATGFGSGGGGGINSSGGAGSAGVVIIRYTIPQSTETARFSSGGNFGIGTTLNGSTARLAVFGGNVGISSATPGTGLDVQGTVRSTNLIINNGATTTGYVWTATNTAGAGSWQAGGGGVGVGTVNPGVEGYVPIYTSNAVVLDDANSALFVTGGNVGIGSIVPGTALDVQGTVRATSFSGSGAGLTGVSGTSQWLTNAGVGIGTYDNVGIGTIVPTSGRLVVIGGNVGFGTATPQGALTVTRGNVGIGTWETTGGKLIVRGNGNVGIGSAFPGTTLDVQGTIRASSTITASGNVGIGTSNPQAKLVILSGNVGIGTWTADAGALIVRGGNVGLGSVSPGEVLDVQGNIRASGSMTTSGSGASYTQGNLGVGSSAPGQALDINGRWRTVGIGTTVPSQICMKADGTVGYFAGAWAGTCN